MDFRLAVGVEDLPSAGHLCSGAVAYDLLTGRPSFLGTTPQMVLSAHMTDTPEPVSKYRESVPPALEQLVMKCLEKKAAPV